MDKEHKDRKGDETPIDISNSIWKLTDIKASISQPKKEEKKPISPKLKADLEKFYNVLSIYGNDDGWGDDGWGDDGSSNHYPQSRSCPTSGTPSSQSSPSSSLSPSSYGFEHTQSLLDEILNAYPYPSKGYDMLKLEYPIFGEMITQSLTSGQYGLASILTKAEKPYAHYLKTKKKGNPEISDDLLAFFDQTGVWYGLGFPSEGFESLSQEKIDPKRCVREAKGKIHLLSSWVQAHSNLPKKLPYDSIGGNIHAQQMTQMELPNLRHCRGDILLDGCVHFEAPKLQSLGGSIELGRCSRLSLPMISYIAKDLKVDRIGFIQLPNLGYLGGSFMSINAEIIEAPRLKYIGTGLTLGYPEKANFENLRVVNDALWVENVQEFYAPKIEKIPGGISLKSLGKLSVSSLRRSARNTDRPHMKTLIEKELNTRIEKKEKFEKIKGTELNLC